MVRTIEEVRYIYASRESFRAARMVRKAKEALDFARKYAEVADDELNRRGLANRVDFSSPAPVNAAFATAK